MLYLGYHLSSVNGFKAMGLEALKADANTFAFFTRNPRGGKAKAIDPEDAASLVALISEAGSPANPDAKCFGPLVAHAPYTLNPCSDKENVREFARLCMSEDMERMEYLPGNYYNFHPGSHVGQGVEVGIRYIVDLLNDILTPSQTTTVLLETMAGKGSEVGGSFEEIAAIIDGVKLKDKIGVCMDTCHVSDAGYDIINDPEGVLDEFDRVVGLSYLKALHINDSKNPPASHKDRHEKIGEGTLGLDVIGRFINNPRLAGLPCILETPNEFEGYKHEIEMLRGWKQENELQQNNMQSQDKRPCTYMLKCSDGTFYTGWTNDIEKRVATHNAGKGGKYTRRRTPVELVHVEWFDTKEEAMSREYAIKQLSRAQKLALISK